MPLSRSGDADGISRASPSPPGSGSLSGSGSTARRRKRVGSTPSLPLVFSASAVNSPKRPKVDGTDKDGMSGKTQAKRAEVVDLTAPAPAAQWGTANAAAAARKSLAVSAPPTAFQPHTGARKLVVKNLRVAAPARTEQVQSYYKKTEHDLDAALASVFVGEAPRVPLERLYRGVEDLCAQGQADKLYRRLRAQCEAHLQGTVLGRMRADTAGKSDIETLQIVYQQWLVWARQSSVIRSMFSYLDRSFLVNERSLPQINDMLIARFRRMVFGKKGRDGEGPGAAGGDSSMTDDAPAQTADSIGSKVLAGMNQLVEQDRRGDAAFDAGLLRNAVSMLHVFNVYGALFEPVFLAASEAFVRDFVQEREATADLRTYIQACKTLLERESVRCNAYNFDSSTKKQLVAMLERILIVDRDAKLLDHDSVAKLLDAVDVASMRGLYTLLRLPGLHKRLRAPWEAYIEKTGLAIVTDVARGDEMVVRLLLLRRTLAVVFRDAFGRDDFFHHGMRDAFGRFINDRAVGKAWASGASKVGEMVAKHLDMLLRGGLKTLPPALLADDRDRADAERSGQASTGDEDAELDRQLDQGLELFRFIQGKDVFEAFYKKDLARRLLMGRSASQDAERNMLSKLKAECGSSLTHNLEQMFKDQELSRDEMAAYKLWLRGTGRDGSEDDAAGSASSAAKGVDLQVSVLSAAAWPSYPQVSLNLPPEVLAQVDLFDKFYKSKHTGRQLTWTHTLGHCLVRARFDRGVKELMVSSFQAAVLLLFNQAEAEAELDGVLSYAQIGAATGLEGPNLVRTLQSLACGKVRVLAKHPKGRNVEPTDTFTVNRAFADPKFRIKINQIQLKETKEENAATYERVSADRQFETQAAIVRIMKSRKSLAHAQLVAEVISQTKNRGALDPALIKQNIEKLIEKDYLEREDGKYVYLA